MYPQNLVNIANIVDVPLLILTMVLCVLVTVCSMILAIRNRREPGRWPLYALAGTCLYMAIFYGLKLFGLSYYDPAGLMLGVMPVDLLLVIILYYRVLEW